MSRNGIIKSLSPCLFLQTRMPPRKIVTVFNFISKSKEICLVDEEESLHGLIKDEVQLSFFWNFYICRGFYAA